MKCAGFTNKSNNYVIQHKNTDKESLNATGMYKHIKLY